MIPNSLKQNLYFYSVVIPITGALASATGILNMDSDAPFKMFRILGTSDQDLDSDFQPNNFSVAITDQGSGRRMMNLEIPQRLLCQPANGGLILPQPVLFSPNTTLNFSVTDLSGNAANIVTIMLAGIKNYDFGNQ